MGFSSSIRIWFYTILQLDGRLPDRGQLGRGKSTATKLVRHPRVQKVVKADPSLSLPGLIAQALIVDWLYWSLAPEQ